MADAVEDRADAMRGAASIVTQLFAVEARAGIAEQANRARRLAVDAMESPDEEFADAKERSLLALRQIYFAVPDMALRKELIHLRRESDRAMRGAVSGVADANKRLAELQRRANALPLVWAGLLAAGCVAVGALLFQLYGAIAGALLGFFAAQGLVARGRGQRAEAVRAAQAAVDREQKRSAELFSAAEEATGEPDASARRDPFPP
jgi:hypothetical protein